MPTLIHHLGKECRDHLASLVAIPLVITALAVGAFVLVDPYWIQTGFMPHFTLWSMVGVAALLAPSLSEQDAGTMALLRRLPEGLGLAFGSKVLLLLGALAATGLFTLALTCGLRASTMTGQFDLLAPLIGCCGWGGVVISLAVGGGLWVLAASFWLPRATLSIPLAVIAMALCLLPLALLLQARPYLVSRLPIGWVLGLHPLLALAMAWVSLVRGRRAGGTAWSSAWRGLCVAGFGCLLVTTAGLMTIRGETSITRADAPILRSVRIGSGGRYAFVNAQLDPRAPTLGIQVDLRDGSWRKFGGAQQAGGFVCPDEIGGPSPFPRSPTPLVAYRSATGDHFTWIDTRTTEVVGLTPLDRPFAGIEPRCRAAVRAASSMLLPDGRRCWFFAGRLEADAVGGGHEQLPWDAQRSPVSMRGFGIQVDGVDAPIYDLIRRRAIATGAARADFVLVLPEAWLVADRVEPDLGKPQLDRGTHAPVPSLRAADQLVTVQQDGQVIVRNTDGDPANRGLFRVDPVSDRRQRLVTKGLDVSKAACLRGSWTYAPEPRRLHPLAVDPGTLAARLSTR